MKAERRHELQENELAKVIKKAPNFWQESGGKFLAVSVAVLVIVLLIRYRITSTRQAAVLATERLSNARAFIDELGDPRMAAAMMMGAPGDMANQRRVQFNEANNAIADAIRLSDDKKIQAEALLAKGDLSWTLASLPPIPGSATQPALLIRDPKDLLNTATEAYQQVVNNYADQKYAHVAARFGLAAVAENRSEWEQARTQYEKVATEAKDLPAYQQLAAQRLVRLNEIRQPVLLGTPAVLPPMPTIPGTRPVPDLLRPTTAGAATAPASPATLTAAPAAPPATSPAVAPTMTSPAPETQPAATQAVAATQPAPATTQP
ncbi:MAG TPA: hypothetical protein VER17_00705 [Tepidisphaeraceae bacterium]|nr:hypothetical protein [Tepidisphaeraceae bacterium]